MAAAWLALPWWLFLAVALYCYFVPFFRPLSLAPAFLIFLFMSAAAPVTVASAVYAGAIMTLMLGIKDFLIVNRKAAYQLLVFLLSFAGCLLLFSNFEAWSIPASFLSLAFLALLWFWLLSAAPDKQEFFAVPGAIFALILFEIGAVIFLLPISFFSQAALLFFGSVLLFEAATDPTSITFKRLSIWGGAYAAISLLVALLASWEV